MEALTELLRRPEGKTLEFKRDLSSPAGVIKTMVAFANTAGGTLLVGVDDSTAQVRGVEDVLDLEERLASLVSDGIEPRLVPDVEIVQWRGLYVVAVEVHSSSLRPHHVSREGADRGVYVRVGSTNRRADPQMIAELGRYARGVAYDEQPMPHLDSEAVDFIAASESFSAVRHLRRSDLETLRLVVAYQGKRVPTVGGMLLFGVNREHHFPDAWIQAGRFAGSDRSRILDRVEIRGPLPGAVEEAVAFVHRHTLHGAEIGAVRRRERPSVPPVAVREAVVNAVAHADYGQFGAPIRIAMYDDRLEVENPGLLPFGLTVEDLPRGVSKLRNRVIGRVFHELGLIEQWGSGVQRMAAACRDAGLPPPVFEEMATRFRVTLFTEPVNEVVLDGVDRAILGALAGSEGRSTSDLAAVIGRSTRATRTRLVELIERGLVVEVGTSPQDPKRLYYATRHTET
ncbi:MAG: ATP-binding protein [Acidimicrobiia bacterium]